MIQLHEIPTRAPKGLEKEDIKRKTDRLTRRIGELQHIMYAEKKKNFLFPFRKPTEEEFAHDFLWRISKRAPAKGMIQVFIRSHYEDVLIQRVHKWIDEEKVGDRIKAINVWENHIQQDNNTTILKFYMHISPERQKEKLQERIDDPRKHWKHNDADWKEAERWGEYMFCYEDAINRSEVPWIIAPVDQRWYRDYYIAEKVMSAMESLNMKLPTFDTMKRKE